MKQLRHSCQSYEQEVKGARKQVRQLEDKMRVMVDREQLQQIKRDHQVGGTNEFINSTKPNHQLVNIAKDLSSYVKVDWRYRKKKLIIHVL